jgi:hypothetical protein
MIFFCAARGDVSVDTAATIHIDEWKQLVEHRIAGVDDINFGEMNNSIAVCVRACDMEHPGGMPVQMEGYLVRKSKRGQSGSA